MKVLAIIPARQGSKRLPGKNRKLLGGIPLVVWAINSLKQIPEITDILVSTDDPEVIKIANQHSVLAPWIRPEHLSSDEASSIEVTLHALDWYQKNIEEVDGVMLIQPTSPFRTTKSILAALAEFKSYESVVTVSSRNSNPRWSFHLESDFLVKPGRESRELYELNGLIYLCTPKFLFEYRTFITDKTRGLIISSEKESLDIDTQEDFDLAEIYLNMDF